MASTTYKKIALNNAYDAGLRHCPCCGVQLVWKANVANLQKNLATVDHMVPRSIGGADTYLNMFIMCRSCNAKRHTTCFVTYVTSCGYSKSKAEELYRTGHKESLKTIIATQFTTVFKDKKEQKPINKKRKQRIKDICKNYVEYFGDYLPEFDLIERLL